MAKEINTLILTQDDVYATMDGGITPKRREITKMLYWCKLCIFIDRHGVAKVIKDRYDIVNNGAEIVPDGSSIPLEYPQQVSVCENPCDEITMSCDSSHCMLQPEPEQDEINWHEML